MEELKFDTLRKAKNKNIDLLERNLRQVGQKLSDSIEYVYPVVSVHSQSNENDIDEVKSAALLLLVPSVGYNYRFLTLDYRTKSVVIVKLFDLVGQNIQQVEVNISKDKNSLSKELVNLLTTEKAIKTINFFIERVEEEMFETV